MPRFYILIATVVILFVSHQSHSQPTLQQQLVDACWAGNLENLKAIPLAKAARSGPVYGGGPAKPVVGADVQYADESGLTPMHIAAFKGNVPVMQYLLENGAEADVSTKSDVTPLHLAVQEGHIPAVEFLISNKVDSRPRTSDGLTPFFLAIQSGRKDMIDFLIDLQKAGRIKKDWNTKDKSGNTLLHYAAATKNLDLLRVVLSEYDDLDAKNATGNTPLHIAAALGDEVMVLALLEKEADVNAMNEGYASPLHQAVTNGHTGVVRILLERKAKLDRRTMLKKTPLHFAAESGNIEMFTLLDQTDPTVLKDEESILHSAIESGQLALVQKCIAAGHDVNYRDGNDRPAIIKATIQDSPEITQALMAAGAHIDVRDKADRTPLHYACMNGDIAVVQALVDKGADVKAEDDRDFTPLHFACLQGHAEVVRYLLSAGAEVNAKTTTKGGGLLSIVSQVGAGLLLRQSPSGKSMEQMIEQSTNEAKRTPLHMAISGGHEQIVSLLLEKGANPNMTTAWENTVLHLAATQGSLELMKQLLSMYPDALRKENDKDQTVFDILFLGERWSEMRGLFAVMVENPPFVRSSAEEKTPVLHFAAYLGNDQLVGALLDAGADVNRVHMMTPLQFALLGGQSTTVSLLLARNADPSKKSSNGSNALHAAAASGSLSLLQQILDRIPTAINSENDDDQTPIMLAISSKNMDGVRLLLLKGADSAKKDKSGQGLLHYATTSGSLEMIRLFADEKGMDIGGATRGGITPLHIAAAGGSLEAVQYFLGKGAAVNSIASDSLTPLHLAAAGGHTQVAAFLLDNGAVQSGASVTMWEKTIGGAFDAGKSWGTAGIFVMVGHLLSEDKSHHWKPIHLAARNGHAETVRMLLERGEAASSQTSDKLTPLHLACKNGDVDVIKALLNERSAGDGRRFVLAELAADYPLYGSSMQYSITSACNVNAQDRNGWTPLHWANFFDNADADSFLIGNGADENRMTTRDVKVTDSMVIPEGQRPANLNGLLGAAAYQARIAEKFGLGEKQYALWR